MLARLFLFVALVATSHAQAQSSGQGLDFGRYHALVIGNNDYRNLPRLRTAVADAQGVADVFGSRYGFNVELLLNADRDQIIRAIAQYRNLKDSDNLVIYYAGHGILDEASDRGFWLPVDADNDNEARWIDVAVVSGNLRAMNARHILVIADSCYSGTLTRSAPASLRPTTDRGAWLKRMRDRRARVALVSGGLEPVMDGGGSGHSVFARALINTLRENRDILQGTELFDQLRGRVVVNSPQTPAYDDIRMAGHEGGDFLFVPKGDALATAPASSGAEASMDLAFWDAIKQSGNPSDYRAYLQAFPNGRFAPLARLRAGVTEPESPRPAPVVVAAAPVPRPTVPVPASIPAPPPQQTASLPPPQKAIPVPAPAAPRGAVADANAFQDQWSTIRNKLWLQYERSWRGHDNAMSFEGVTGYRLVTLDADALVIDLDYRAVGVVVTRTENRSATVRLRNTPEFEILEWNTR